MLENADQNNSEYGHFWRSVEYDYFYGDENGSYKNGSQWYWYCSSLSSPTILFIFVFICVFTSMLQYLRLKFIYLIHHMPHSYTIPHRYWSTFTFKTDKYLNTIPKQSTNANFKLLFQDLKVIFTKLKALLISMKLTILLMLLMSKMMLIEGVMMNVKMMLMSIIAGQW